jgi:RimJ/RimL family protein N-acetyltransferase
VADTVLARGAGAPLLAQQGDRVVAFTYFGPHQDGLADAEIFDLYAHPSYWGTGVA